jgi:predicted aconitase with swiveling domain
VLDEPLSFWGGLDSANGRIIDRRHPQLGRCVTDRVLVLPGGRGSSSSSTVLAEAIRRGTAPLGILLRESDAILALGAIVAQDLYNTWVPVLVLQDPDYKAIRDGDWLSIDAAGNVRVIPGRGPADSGRSSPEPSAGHRSENT